MARPNLKRNIQSGVLSTGNVAFLLSVNAETVRGWCDSGKLKHHLLPGTSERRIVASDAKEFALKHNMKYKDLLDEACENFRSCHHPQ